MQDDISRTFYELYRDATIACRAHHISAEHSMRMYAVVGPPISLVLLLTSLYLLGVDKGVLYPKLLDYQQAVGLIIGFLSATISGLSSLFNFKEDALRHKYAAERYNSLSRKVVALRIGNYMTLDTFLSLSNEFSHIQSASPHVSNKQFKSAVSSVNSFAIGGDYWDIEK